MTRAIAEWVGPGFSDRESNQRQTVKKHREQVCNETAINKSTKLICQHSPINQESVEAPEIRWSSCQVACSFHKRCKRRHTVANEVVGLYQNCPVDHWQPRISMVHPDLCANGNKNNLATQLLKKTIIQNTRKNHF